MPFPAIQDDRRNGFEGAVCGDCRLVLMMNLKPVLYDWGGANAALFRLVNDAGAGNSAYQRVMLAGSQAATYKILPCYLAVLLLGNRFYGRWLSSERPTDFLSYRKRWREAYVVLVLSYLANVAWVDPMKYYLRFPRPYIVLPAGSVHIADHVRHAVTLMSSFPSGHAAFAATLVFSLWPVSNLYGKILALSYLAWVCISRVALGVHFPADVSITLAITICVVYGIRRAVGRAHFLENDK